MSDPNPYQAPSTTQAPPVPDHADPGLVLREGKFLLVRDGAELPDRCIITNQAVGTEGKRKRALITWSPPWVFIGILSGIIPLLILMLIFQKKAKISYSMSRQAWGRIVNRRLIGTFLLLASIGLFFLGANSTGEQTGIYMTGGIVALIASLIVFITATPLKAVKHRNGWFRVKGCSPEFLDTLPEATFPF